MRDRYLFPADRKSSEYRTLLEITSRRARLLTPSERARRVRWVVSIAFAIVYVGLWVWLVGPSFATLSRAGLGVVAAGLIFGAFSVLWFVGALLLFRWWDRESLPLLAEAPSQSLELVLFAARSFGTFQDVRARIPSGEEIHLVVDAREQPFWEAVRLLEGKAAMPG